MNNQLTETNGRAVAMALYGAMATGDLDSAAAVLADDVVLRVPGSHPLAGEHRGPDGVLEFVLASRERTDDGEDIEVLDVLDSQDYVGVYCRVRATRQGRAPLDNYTVHLLHIDQGRVTEIRLHNFDDFPVNDFWS